MAVNVLLPPAGTDPSEQGKSVQSPVFDAKVVPGGGVPNTWTSGAVEGPLFVTVAE